MIKMEVKLPAKGALEKQAIESIKRQLSDKLKTTQCLEHHQGPELIVSGTLTNLKIEVKGCCQKLIDAAKQALN